MSSSLHLRPIVWGKGRRLFILPLMYILYESCWFSTSFGRRGSLARIHRGLHTFLLFLWANFVFDFKLLDQLCVLPQYPLAMYELAALVDDLFHSFLDFLLAVKKTFNKEVSCCSATWSLPFILGPLHWPSIREQRNIVPAAIYYRIHYSLITKNKLKQRNIFNVWCYWFIVYARSMAYEWDVESTKSCTGEQPPSN